MANPEFRPIFPSRAGKPPLGFNVLRNNALAEAATRPSYGTRNRLGVRVPTDVPHECATDLDVIHRQTPNMAERRISSAEFIDLGYLANRDR